MTGEVGGRYLECEGKDITNMWNIYNHIYIYIECFYMYIYYLIMFTLHIFVWLLFLEPLNVSCLLLPPLFSPMCWSELQHEFFGGDALKARKAILFLCLFNNNFIIWSMWESIVFLFLFCVCVSLVIWMCSCVWRFFLNGVNKKIVLNYKPWFKVKQNIGLMFFFCNNQISGPPVFSTHFQRLSRTWSSGSQGPCARLPSWQWQTPDPWNQRWC